MMKSFISDMSTSKTTILTRRQFLSATTAAITTFHILPATLV